MSNTLNAHEREMVRKAIRIMTLCDDSDSEQLLSDEIMVDDRFVNPDAFHGMLLLCGMLLGLRHTESGEARTTTLGHLGVALEILEDHPHG